MVRIRLLRVGAIRQPSYRIVVSDQRSPRDGRFIEIIGNFNPRTEPNTIVVNRERALFWLERGAQPSEAVARLLEKTSVMAIKRGETTLEEVVAQDAAPA
ncbi:MAG: 30S ribosomal protein S16 [Anaerolineae bacterium]|jgi:small subunit ribosomal protein S16